MSANLPQLLTDQAVLQATFDTGSLKAGIENNLPTLTALGRVGEINAGLAENRYKGSYFEILDEQDGARIRVNSELANAEQIAAEAGVTIDHIKRYTDAVNAIDQSTPEGRQAAFMAATFISNPGFGNYLAQQSDQDFRLRLAQFQAMPTDAERARLTIDIHTEMSEASERLQKLVTDGASEDAISSGRAELDNWGNIAQELQGTGAIHTFDIVRGQPERGFWGGMSGNEFVTQKVRSQRVRNIYEAVSKGEATVEEVNANLDGVFTRDDEKVEWNALINEATKVESEISTEKPTEEPPARPKTAQEIQTETLNLLANTEIDDEEKAIRLESLRAMRHQFDIITWLQANNTGRQQAKGQPRGRAPSTEQKRREGAQALSGGRSSGR